MEIPELAGLLVAMGCPADKSSEMAAQLEKRAGQLAVQKGRTHDEALRHLLALFRQSRTGQPNQPD